jgi:outer membrane biosynthesis protein TonB
MAFNENSNRNKAKIGTIVFHTLLLLWFAFYGLTYQDPPPEEGIAINFGYEESGSGTTSQAAQATPPPTPVQPVQTPAAQEQVATQDVEDAPTIEEPTEETPKETQPDPVQETPEPVKETTPEPDPQPTEEELEQQRKQERLNKLLGTQNKGNGQGEGVTEGGGDQGGPNGNPLSPNRTGNGGIGNNGKYWMSGEPIRLPEPETGCNYEGVVVIKIVVDETGSVREAELAPQNQIPPGLVRSNFGSNTCLVNKAKIAAKNSKWSADAGNFRRVGFIVYRFELQ